MFSKIKKLPRFKKKNYRLQRKLFKNLYKYMKYLYWGELGDEALHIQNTNLDLEH